MRKVTLHIRRLLLNEFKRGCTAADAVRNISMYMGREVLSYSTAKYWFKRFRRGDVSLKDISRPGRPSAIDPHQLQALIEADPTQTTRNLAKQLKTSHTTIERHLREMGMKFSNNRWVYSQITQEAQNRSLDINGYIPHDQSFSFENQSASCSISTALSQNSVTEERNYDQSDADNWIIELPSSDSTSISQTSTTKERNYDQTDADD